MYDQNQQRFSAPGQFYVHAPGATPPQQPQPYQIVQDQPPPGYQFQQYYQPITLPIQHDSGLQQQTPVTPVNAVPLVTPVNRTLSSVTQEVVDAKNSSKTEQSENKQNDKDKELTKPKVPLESPLVEMLQQEDSNSESIYLKLTKSDLEKPEWKRLLVNYSADDLDEPVTDQGQQTLKTNDSITVTNVQQMAPVPQTTSVNQSLMPPASLMQPVQPVPPPPAVPPVMEQPMYYSTPQYISGPDVLVQTAASLLQPKNMP